MALEYILLIAVLVLGSGKILPAESNPGPKDPEICQKPVCYESAKFLLDAMDPSVDPCEDFYRYSCGGWIEKHPIPGGRHTYSVFQSLNDEIHDKIAENLKTINDEEYPKPVVDAAIFYQGCIDKETRERKGLDPLVKVLDSLGGWPMVKPDWSDAGYQWYMEVAKLKRTLGVEAIILTKTESDDENEEEEEEGELSQNIIINEPAFGIYTSQLRNKTSSDYAKRTVAAYRNYIIATGRLLNPNIDEAELANGADEIIQFETTLAQYPRLTNESKDGQTPWYMELIVEIQGEIEGKEEEPVTVADADEITENTYFKWIDFLREVFKDLIEVTEETRMMIGSRDYLRHAVKVASTTNPRIVANYIGWIFLKELGRFTTRDFRNIAFEFRKVQAMIEKPETLEKTCVKDTIMYFEHAISRLYVDRYLTEEEINDVVRLSEDIRSAFEVNLNHNTWMDAETKNKALEKLRAMKSCVGYPSWIQNDTELINYYLPVPDLEKDEFFENVVKVKRASLIISFRGSSSEGNESTRWNVSPAEVNAVYNPSANSITFPAAIFNPPIYKYGRSPALNYAGIGSFITHEMTHGFDNQGSAFDKDGKLANWWSPETKKQFKEKAECIRKQYSSFVEPMTNKSLNGRQTLGDDIADNGGLRNAFFAFKLQVLQSEENEVIRNTRLPGLDATQEQLFFITYGTMECSRYTKLAMATTIATDAHSPPEYRILVPLSNSRAFAEAFNCPVGSRMNPEAKCQLW